MSESEKPRIDPHARRFLAMVALGAAPGEVVPIAARRRSFEALMRLSKPPSVDVAAEDFSFPACGADIPLRLYTPGPARTRMPGLVYFHGGGLVAGSLDTHDALCRTLAHAAGCRIVAVGYRLAPEHPFPVPVLDALLAARWITRHASAFGLDPAAIAIGGDSGGATLATVACQVLRRRKLFKAQLLLCPVLDFAGGHASREAYGAGYMLDAATMVGDLACYAPTRALDDSRISPLRAPSLDGLPPTIIRTAGYDPLCDEGAAYAARLEAAGVAVRHKCHETLIHHFYGLPGVIPVARAALAEIATDLAAALA